MSDIMVGLDELFDYKNQLIKDMLSNETVVRLLDNSCVSKGNPKDLVYKQVFPYEYVPDVTEHGQTFICCEVDIKDVIDKTFLTPAIYIWVFTHKSLLRLDEGGVRVDKISSEITKEINGSRLYGQGELEIYSAKRFSPITDYQGRILTFYARDFNRLYSQKKGVPANRKSG